MVKDFYNEYRHKNQYIDISFVELNSLESEYRSIKDYIEYYILESMTNNMKIIKIRGIVTDFVNKGSNTYPCCVNCYRKIEGFCNYCYNKNVKLQFKISVKIKDFSDYLWVEMSNETAENFLGVTPEYYQKLINNKNEDLLNEIRNRIMYKDYIFIGKFSGPPLDDGHENSFLCLYYNNTNEQYYKKSLDILKSMA